LKEYVVNNVLFSLLSECGPVRNINQDSVTALQGENGCLFCIADGMGGYSEGEKASGDMIDSINKWWEESGKNHTMRTMSNAADELEKVISQVNIGLYEYGKSNLICGTTVSILCIYGDSYFVLAVGDSRIYERKGRKFKKLTVDEIWNNKWVVEASTGKKIPDPKYGMLLNAVGTERTISVMRTCGSIDKNTMFILCSDGLYKFCKEKYIKKAVKYKKKADLKKRIGALKEQVVQNGEKDNLSVILVKVEQR